MRGPQAHAEQIHLDERLVVSPRAGVFFPAYTEVRPEEIAMVAVGDEIGVVVQNGEKHPVHCPFTGQLMGLLAAPGQRVRAYEPVAWLTTADGVDG
jgi:biotin carboxyl carrier protein